MNQVSVIGNLGQDPELRYTPSGVAVCKLSVAINRRYQVDGEWKDDTTWVRVDCWKDLAENVAESLEKGDRVIVVGRIKTQSWEDDQGEKRSSQFIDAEDVGVGLRFATVKEVHRQSKGGDRD